MNLGNPNEFTVLELAQAILQELGSSSEIRHPPLPQDDPKVRQPDITLARSVLGWEPRVSLKEGLHRTIPYFRDAVARGGADARALA